MLIFAVTSTLPYLMFALPLVTRRADWIGLMICPMLELETATHWDTLDEVQVPSVVRLRL